MAWIVHEVLAKHFLLVRRLLFDHNDQLQQIWILELFVDDLVNELIIIHSNYNTK